MGPTASGKTRVALALARQFPVEVVSVDSAQVYRGMDVGTAKPTAAERGAVPHHLLDILDPSDAYSAGRFRTDALRVAGEIIARGNIPLFAGGTMLYFRTLTRGLADLPPAHPEVRAALDARAAVSGWPALHAELSQVDPETARRLEPTDAQRIQRALEVHAVSGRALSDWLLQTPVPDLPFTALQVALEPSERSVLHERIATRFHAMLAGGLVEEVEGLRTRFRLQGTMPSMRAVGYRQAWEVLEGTAPREALAERGIAATRQLAKRQLTWLRSMAGVERFDALAPGLELDVAGRVGRFLDGQSSP